MAFRTNKVPAIEKRTVSGSSVSFNSAFALPLKACKVSFMATQSGSGDPSPSNPRAISGVSAIGLTANSTPVSVNFGDTYYGGYVDLLNKKGHITYGKATFDGSESWGYTSQYIFLGFNPMASSKFADGMANWLKTISSIWGNGIGFGSDNRMIYITHGGIAGTGVTDLASWKAYLSEHNLDIIYPLYNPIEIDLPDLPDISSILGDNTFSTDTGSLEISFQDLQEKSASGAIATFNTALAMPLASCNIAVNAWQEGSGEPSPSNVRAIHGFSEINPTRAGKNLIRTANLDFVQPVPMSGDANTKRIFTENSYCLGLSATNYTAYYQQDFDYYSVDNNSIKFRKNRSQGYGVGIPLFNLKIGEGYKLSANAKNANVGIAFYKEDGTYISRALNPLNNFFTVPLECVCTVVCIGSNTLDVETSLTDIQIEAGSTATAYEPYVTPTIYTKALGETVYGGSYNIDGTKKKNASIVTFNNTNGWSEYSTYFRTSLIEGMDATISGYNGLCNIAPVINYIGNGIMIGSNARRAFIGRQWLTEHNINSLADMDNLLANTPLSITFPLAEPIETNIGATPISTNIGNNTIFADTGDIDLTYKDLDIAKRGNFREVFKLPS